MFQKASSESKDWFNGASSVFPNPSDIQGSILGTMKKRDK